MRRIRKSSTKSAEPKTDSNLKKQLRPLRRMELPLEHPRSSHTPGWFPSPSHAVESESAISTAEIAKVAEIHE
jgi:hypothetical protein